MSALLLSSCTHDNDDLDIPVYQSALVHNLIETVCSETGTPGVSVHVISPDYGDCSFVWGVSDLDTQTPVKPGDLFRVGSLTKSFTGAAIVNLVENGLIDLNRPVSDYLGLVDDYALLSDISVRDLLNMSSGLAEYLSESFLVGSVLADPLQGYEPGDLLAEAFASSPDLLFAPGTTWSYSNTNYVLLGLIIEAVSGLGYEDYLQEVFITPLGLDDTRVMLEGTIPDGLVRGYYDSDENNSYDDWTEMNMSYVWSAGCIVSTAKDIATWMRILASGGTAGEDFLPYLFEGHAIADGIVYGAGIVVDDSFGIGHNGTVIGYHADAWHDPDTGNTVAVLCNTNDPLLSDDRDPTREIAEGILAILK